MIHRLVSTLAALLAAGITPFPASAAETSPATASPPPTSPATTTYAPADIHITSATWQYFPGVEILNATHFISIPQAQSILNQHAEQLLDCYAPTTYNTDGTLLVQLHIGPTGIPVGVRGDTTGIAPLQARCMLKQAWLYEFEAPAHNEQQAAIQYRIFFPTERTYSTPLAANRPNMIIENVRAYTQNDAESIPTPELTQQLLERADDLRTCQALALKELPNDLLVTDITMNFRKVGTTFQPSDLDLVLTNQTSSTMPSDALLACLRQNIARWQITLPPNPTQQFSTRFFITFHPPK